jgi:UDP-N-acetylmuramate--alanine ligase
MVGIGGVGMAGVAAHLRSRGLHVSGCDLAASPVTAWLSDRGIGVLIGHGPEHIGETVDWVIRTPAVEPGDPEIRRALDRGLPVFLRGVVLPALLDQGVSIAVTGTHGKTTTTAMIAQTLRGCGVDASFAVGAEVPALGGVAGVGRGGVTVVEADESDGTAALYETDYAVITNAEMDHVDFFRSEEDLDGCLLTFALNARRAAVVCLDDPGVRRLLPRIPRRLTYGFHADAAVRGVEAEGSSCGVVWRGKALGRMALPVPGAHNLQNALGACAAALEMGHEFPAICGALAKFEPARRRFEVVAKGDGITVISDYAHHPTEIRALMRQASGLGARRLLAVFQPHRYTRTRAFAPEFPSAFDGVDELVLLPVYAASEKPVAGGTSRDLLKHFDRPVRYAESLEDAWRQVRLLLREGDVLLVVGAGDVEKIAFLARDVLNRRAKAGTTPPS